MINKRLPKQSSTMKGIHSEANKAIAENERLSEKFDPCLHEYISVGLPKT